MATFFILLGSLSIFLYSTLGNVSLKNRKLLKCSIQKISIGGYFLFMKERVFQWMKN